MKSSLGAYIERLRIEKNLSQRDLGRLTGYSYTQIARLESGETQSPGLHLIIALSKALNVNVVNLILAYEGKDPDAISVELVPDLENALEGLSKAISNAKDALKKNPKE